MPNKEILVLEKELEELRTKPPGSELVQTCCSIGGIYTSQGRY